VLPTLKVLIKGNANLNYSSGPNFVAAISASAEELLHLMAKNNHKKNRVPPSTVGGALY
jgi:hypothetical protein